MLLPLSGPIVHAVQHRRISQWPEDTVDMDAFILKAGGNDWKNKYKKIRKTLYSTPEKGEIIKPRYLVTCRCGIDRYVAFLTAAVHLKFQCGDGAR